MKLRYVAKIRHIFGEFLLHYLSQAFINYNEGRRSVYYLEQEEKWAFCITLSEIGKNNTSSRLRKKENLLII